MRLAITDANIFIDLIELDLIVHLFGINLEIQTTLAVISELNDTQQEQLQSFVDNGQLVIRFLTDEQEEAMNEMEVNKGFSDTDKTLLFFCQTEKLLMLTGEGLMRRYCKRHNLEVRGIIWLFDSFLSHNLIDHTLAIERMEQLLLLNSRLPVDECENHLKAWQESIQ